MTNEITADGRGSRASASGLRRVALALIALAAICGPAAAQELEPRAFSPAPVGLNFGVLVGSYSTGDLVFDASVPITDAEADAFVGTVAYARTIDILGMSGKISAAVPWAYAKATGLVAGDYTEKYWSGLADPLVGFSVLFLNSPALSPKAYAAAPHAATVAGLSLAMSMPLGRYEEHRIINIGQNRFTFRPRLGISHTIGRWVLEGIGGGTFFTTNDEYLNVKTLTQDPLWSVQAHVVYQFKPRMWLALDGTYYWGGQTDVDGVPQPNRQSSTRLGTTFALPLGKRDALKLHLSSGVSTRAGSKFTTIAVAYQTMF